MTTLKKQIALCTLGTIFEWYEFTIFASLMPIISKLFFPYQHGITASLSAFAVFASGFLMRPLGAILFGHFGDIYGRKYAMLLSIFLMTLSTVAIGLLPIATMLSAYLLVTARLLQGFAASGEYPAALAFLLEQHDVKRKNFVTSFSVFGTGLGCLLGALIYALLFYTLGIEELLSGAWRIPFLLAIPFGILSIYLRRSLQESFQTRQLHAKIPFLILFQKYKQTIFLLLLISIFANTLIYINLFYFSQNNFNLGKLSQSEVLLFYLSCTCIYSIAILFSGFLADYLPKNYILVFCAIALTSLIYPIFWCNLHGSITLQWISQIIFAGLLGAFVAPYVSVLGESFPPSLRCSALSFILNIAASFFGGTAPILCSLLIHYSHNDFFPAYYLIALGLLSSAILYQQKYKQKNNAPVFIPPAYVCDES